jgi:TorA maturation chaperone TorD
MHAGSIYFQDCRGGKMLPLASLCPESTHTAVAEVMRFYFDAGLTIEEAFQLMPGHISLGFLFMSHLINTERLELQKRFWEEL